MMRLRFEPGFDFLWQVVESVGKRRHGLNSRLRMIVEIRSTGLPSPGMVPVTPSPADVAR